MNSIEAIVSEFDSMYCERTNTTLATVTSAVELEEGQQALIAKKVQEITGAKSVKLKPVIDESVIGGLCSRWAAMAARRSTFRCAASSRRLSARSRSRRK